MGYGVLLHYYYFIQRAIIENVLWSRESDPILMMFSIRTIRVYIRIYTEIRHDIVHTHTHIHEHITFIHVYKKMLEEDFSKIILGRNRLPRVYSSNTNDII